MRGLLAIGCAVLVGVFVGVTTLLAGEYQQVAVLGSDVALTNTQQNSSWTLAGVLMRWVHFPEGTVTVSRVSYGTEYFLASADGSTSSNLWWAADGEIYFKYGDALKVYTGGATGTVQVMQKTGE